MKKEQFPFYCERDRAIPATKNTAENSVGDGSLHESTADVDSPFSDCCRSIPGLRAIWKRSWTGDSFFLTATIWKIVVTPQ
jgi:hypothetical protein